MRPEGVIDVHEVNIPQLFIKRYQLRSDAESHVCGVLNVPVPKRGCKPGKSGLHKAEQKADPNLRKGRRH